MKTMQQQLQEAYLEMNGILSQEDNQIISEILALDELSKKTLGSYINKAAGGTKGIIKHAYSAGEADDIKKANKHSAKANKRVTGIANATKRLTKEDVEQAIEELFQEACEGLDESVLTELSKKTLGSYINKAANSAAMSYGKHKELQAASDEVDRFTNRHMDDKFKARDKMKAAVGASLKDVESHTSKAIQRIHGISQATKRLTREQKELIGSILEELLAESED